MPRRKNHGIGIWEVIGFLTAIPFIPFIFIEEWNKVQRRKRRR
jgi:hypothetical protein